MDRSHASSSSSVSQSTHYSDYLDDTIAAMEYDSSEETFVYSPPSQTTSKTAGPSNPGKRRLADPSTSPTPVRKLPRTSASSSTRGSSSIAFATASSVVSTSAEAAVIIVYLPDLQAQVNTLPWGVQWEIARLISAGQDCEKFTKSMLNNLQMLGSNAKAAPEVTRLTQQSVHEPQDPSGALRAAYAKEHAAMSPWEELDREHKHMAVHPLSGLGCNPENLGNRLDPDWYGGRVQFSAQLVNGKIILDRAVLGPSNRVTRRFGSHALLRVRIPSQALYSHDGKVIQYFLRPFVLNGRVFRVWAIKTSTALLVATHETWDGVRLRRGHGMSYLAFNKWHNPMEFNENQTMVKWAARAVLALSNSFPGIELRPDNIHILNDITSPSYVGSGKCPSEKIMTDGCGLANSAVFRHLQAKLHWEFEPTAIQCRIAGAKGLLLLHPDPMENKKEEPTVWLRPSQIKITYDAPPGRYLSSRSDRERRIIDVLRASRMSSPARLSPETLINFAENGVPVTVFQDLMRKAMKEKAEALTTWAGPTGPQNLWANVARAGNVISARLAREMAGLARAKGLVFDDFDNGDEDEDEDEDDRLEEAYRERSSAWWDDPVSGCPSSLEETVMVLLDSGFLPETCPVLKAKLMDVIKRVISGYYKKLRVDTPMSCSAFIVPDPCGVLRSGEVHIKSSRRNLVDQDGKLTDMIVGDVVVTRHPCKVPTDAQKVTAVFHEKLRKYVDVIVISTEDHHFEGKSLGRHLASMTGGGDYDGDMMEAYWQPGIVDNFVNAHPSFANEPAEVQACLLKNTETVKEFMARVPPSAVDDHIREVQKYLLGPLKEPSLVGKYSKWWENSIYTHDYRHPETVFLAYVFCAILDGIKTGVTVHPDTLRQHQKKFDTQKVLWWKKDLPAKGTDRAEKWSDRPFFKREQNRPFVMDVIHDWAYDETERILAEIETRFNSEDFGVKLDTDLAAPWTDATARAQRLMEKRGDNGMMEELAKIREHVQTVRKMWKALKTPSSKQTAFTDLPIVERQDTLRRISREFHSGPVNALYFDSNTVTRLRASYAYLFDRDESRYKKWSRFPWDTAMRTLCEIKAQANGPAKTVTEAFYAGMQLNRAFIDRS